MQGLKLPERMDWSTDFREYRKENVGTPTKITRKNNNNPLD